jgi:hypothetical protein
MAQVKTESEMFPLVESWLKSGLTQKEFSRQHHLPLHILPYWLARYRKTRPLVVPSKQQSPPQKESPAFIRLSAPAAVVAAADPACCTTAVELPSGVVLRFSGLVPVSYLKELVGLYSPVC